MPGGKKIKPKGKNAKPQKRNNKPTPFLKQLQTPVAIGAVQSSKRTYPVGRIGPSGFIVKNFELSKTYSAGSGAFTVDGFTVNPGIAANFPWLSAIAQNYQKFRFLYLRYFYSTTVATTIPGKAYIMLSYDAQDSAPSTLPQVMASENASAGPGWFGGAVNTTKGFDTSMNGDSNIFVDVDCSRFASPWYYVRDATTGGTQPSSGGALTGAPTGGIGTLAFTQGSYVDETAIPCKVYYGTNGVTNGTVPGELYVAYICEFCDPIAAALTV